MDDDPIPPPMSARERELLSHVEGAPPVHVADWPAYISRTDESLRASLAFDRRYKLNHFLEERSASWTGCDDRIKGMYSWRKVFAGTVLAKRLRLCMTRVASAYTVQEQERRLAAIADALPDVKPCYRQVVVRTMAEYTRRCSHMVRCKIQDGDRAWANAVYPAYHFLSEYILEEAVAERDTELVCQLVPLMPPGPFPRPGAHVVFDALDAGRLVAAIGISRVRVSWEDALANHRLRELRRTSDPAVPPLPPEFYDMVLEMSIPPRMCYSFHQDVMHTLDALVEMHRDGRVGRADLDRARDRIFAEAAARGPYPSYSYLLEDSSRLLTERFSAAVIPFALAAKRAAAATQ
eukprot:jgi/Tetstr1/464153/TSEL_008958.t1